LKKYFHKDSLFIATRGSAVKSSTAYAGRFVTVEKRRAVLPGGRSVRIECVKHPGAVLIVPFLSPQRIVLLRQYRPVIEDWLYELPAGTIEQGEKPLSCARREIIEETGFRAGSLRRIGRIYPVPGYSTEIITMFAAEHLSAVGMACEDDEIIEPLVFNKRAVRDLLQRGRLIDAKTICALALCGWL
jgi:ADP-ribose pyrophosphatase